MDLPGIETVIASLMSGTLGGSLGGSLGHFFARMFFNSLLRDIRSALIDIKNLSIHFATVDEKVKQFDAYKQTLQDLQKEVIILKTQMQKRGGQK